jgi:hypothetical protein
MCLTPEPGTDTFDRSSSLIHGDNVAHDASHGCVILRREIRDQIATSADRRLNVKA